jgi:arylsulfatase A-like enzyme
MIAMSQSRPNVIIIHCHDLGQHLGCYGVASVVSPNLDAFAASGVRFANHFCTSPSCSPSRASIFTGRYPHNTGVLGLTHAPFNWDLNPDETHLAQLFQAAGYRTACFGVMHETHSSAQRCGYETHDPRGHATTAVDNALTYLRERRIHPAEPFLLTVGFFEPHRLPPAGNPFGDHDFIGAKLAPDESCGVVVPGYLRDTPGTRRELAELQGAIRYIDAEFARLLAAPPPENTFVIFTTDHGIAMPRAKCSLYDPGLRTALLLRGPGLPAGQVREELVSNIDLLPTLLELLGLPVPPNVQGRSLFGPRALPRSEIFAEMTYHDYYDPRRCVRTATHKLIANFSAAPSFMDPSQSWRPRADTVVPVNHALAYHVPVELYDLRQDPWEQTNLANQPAHTAIRRELAARLRRHLEETADPLLRGAVAGPLHWQALAELQP